MNSTKQILFTAVLWPLLASPTIMAQEIDASNEDIPIESLLQAIRQASRPANTMQIKWTYERVNPIVGYFLQPGIQPPSQPVHVETEYAVTVEGIRSKIESWKKTYHTRDTQEPHIVEQSVAVFDGTNQRKLREKTKGRGTPVVGWQYQSDKNSASLTQEVFGWPFNLNNEKLLAKYSLKVLEGPRPALYVLEAVTERGTIYHFTADSSKGFNVSKIECFRAPGDKDYQTNFKLKQYKDGIWYIAERERIRYPAPDETGEPRLEYKVRVTQAEFNIEIPAETFKLEFPHGTKVWDNMLRDWYYVGIPDPEVVDDELSEMYVERTVLPEEQAPETPKNQQPTPQPPAEVTESKAESGISPGIPPAETLPGRKTVVWGLIVAVIVAGCIVVLMRRQSKERS